MTEAHNKSVAENAVHSPLPEPLPSFPGVPGVPGVDSGVGAPMAALHLAVSIDSPQAVAILRPEVALAPKL